MRRRPSFLKVLMLAILISEGELHGYLLYKRIIEFTCMRWRPFIGTMYRLLNDMVREGLVIKRSEGRRYSYVITPKGVEYFIRNSKAPIMRMAGVLTKILEAHLKLPKDASELLTKELRERLKSLIEVLRRYNL